MRNKLSIKKSSLFFLLIIFSLVLTLSLMVRKNLVKRKTVPKDILSEEYVSRENGFDIRKTNSWFSSLYNFPSNVIYAHPGAYKFSSPGLEISSPGISVSSQTVFGAFASNCTLTFDTLLKDAKITHYGYWDVVVKTENENSDESLFYFSQGSPFVYIQSKNSMQINCQVPLQKTPNGFLYEVNERNVYIQAEDVLFLDETTIFSNDGLYRIIILPKDATNQKIQKSKWEIPSSTGFEFKKEKGLWQTKYKNASDFFTLWPHQIPYLEQKPKILGEYNTQLGKLLLVSGETFTTNLPEPNLRKQYGKVKNSSYMQKIQSAIKEDIERFKGKTFPEGVYFRGKDLATIASLIKLADLYDMENERDNMVDFLQKETRNIDEDFYYDNSDFIYKAANSEFGNELGADHHFHYGYYLYVFSTLVEYRPNLKAYYREVAENMLFDIANLGYSEKYPHLRSYSVYEGHSWADPYADFADGNNQESTSEALNAWYGIWLWGKVTQNNEYQNLGEWLFANELAGTRAYWFAYKNPFPEKYERQIASIVWGGKRDFATWFSGEAMHIYGIQILPVTPASLYLNDIPGKNLHIEEIKKLDPNILSHEWADLFVYYLSFTNPSEAVIFADDINSFAGTNSKAVFLQGVYENYERANYIP